MSTRQWPKRSHATSMVAGLAVLAIILGACGSTVEPSAAAATPQPSLATPSPTPEPTPSPAPTPSPTPAPSPTASPSPTPSPSPSAPAATTIDDWRWVYEKKPLTLSGEAGTTTWSKVLFAAKTVSLKWTATPASSAGCTFRYKVTSPALSKAASGTQKVKGSNAASGSRNLTVKYADGVVTVTTDCAKFKVKVTSTGHPGVVIRQATDTFRATGTTQSELNDELAESFGNWSVNSNTKYFTGGTIRVSSFTVTVPVEYELPKWTAPDGTDPALVEAWSLALKNMRTHTEGEAAIGIQAAGRLLAASTKKTFSSVSAMDKYRDRQGDKQVEWAQDKTEAYNEATDYGWTQGAYIP